MSEVFATPTTALLIYGLLTLGRRPRARPRVGLPLRRREPGEIGFGVYLVFPAFYTDVTDSYRLGRAGRVRTDLGGLYFNVLTVLALAAAYAATGNGLLLLTALVMQVQMVQQLHPGRALRRLLHPLRPRRRPRPLRPRRPGAAQPAPRPPRDPRVTELRPRARRLVTGWVVLVVPLLAARGRLVVWAMPEFVARGRAGIELQQLVFDVAWQRRDWPAMALAVVSIALLCFRSWVAAGAVAPRDDPGPAGTTQARRAPAGGRTTRASTARPADAPSPRPTSPTRSCTPPARRSRRGAGAARSTRGSGHVVNPGPSLPSSGAASSSGGCARPSRGRAGSW